VLDFGIASAAGEADLTTGDLLGTAAYLAPERALGRPATPAADLYSLGVVLYELLAGRRPFEAGSDIELAMAQVNAHPAPLGVAAPATPPTLAAACERAMAKDPAARPSAAAFARLLRSPAPPPAAPATVPLPLVPPTPRRPRTRRRGLLVALLLAGIALAALPALAGGLVPRAGERAETPFAVPEATTPVPDEPSTRPADPPALADQPAGDDQRDDDQRDRDDDSSGPGPGGDDSGGGGSSGPG
jgi:eukaryotic-like serine/threonine-protein kinase